MGVTLSSSENILNPPEVYDSDLPEMCHVELDRHDQLAT